jgi:uncharacterized protein YndB with AHSA1/START domain
VTPGPRILGGLASVGGTGVLRIEDRFDTQVDDVWSALTEPDRLAGWYGEVDGDLRLGGAFRARVVASGWEGAGRVEACEPPRRFVVVSRDPDEPHEDVTEVRLTADGDRTMIVVEQKGLPLEVLHAYAAGMQIHVEDLGDHLAGRERRDAGPRFDELLPAYQALAADLA